MQDKPDEDDIESIWLPRNWSQSERNATLNVLGILRIAMLDGRKLLMERDGAPEAQVQRSNTEVASVNEELRILRSRTSGIKPRRRRQYSAADRMAILELRALGGWSKAETARHFLVSDATIRDWLKRAEDDKLLQRSPWVREEVRYALRANVATSGQRPLVAPVILGATQPWEELQGLDFTAGIKLCSPVGRES